MQMQACRGAVVSAVAADVTQQILAAKATLMQVLHPYCSSKLEIFQNCSIFRFWPSSQISCWAGTIIHFAELLEICWKSIQCQKSHWESLQECVNNTTEIVFQHWQYDWHMKAQSDQGLIISRTLFRSRTRGGSWRCEWRTSPGQFSHLIYKFTLMRWFNPHFHNGQSQGSSLIVCSQ